uniref:Variant surface glycoprotein 1125.4142 n=1 Tax=Trypanosoma brucei TaxID=5691 RepID=A0A1J0R9X3_9TRYP|nr:variant surface glycoprotein 1125.4142 [Trypanosoma brucei]
MKAAALLLAVTIVAARQASAAAGDALNKAAWQPMCEMSEDLDALPSNAAAKLNEIVTAAEEMAATGKRLQLYACAAQSAEDRSKAAILAPYFHSKGAAILTKLKTSDGLKLVESAAKPVYAKGRLDELLNLFQQSKTTNHGCLNDGTPANTVTKSGDVIDGVTCKLKLSAIQATFKATTTITATGFNKQPIATNQGSTQQSNAGKNCKMLKLSGVGLGGEALSSGGTTEVEYGAALFKADRTGDQLTGTDMTKLTTTAKTTAPIWADAATASYNLGQINPAEYKNASASAEQDEELQTVTSYVTKEGAPAAEKAKAQEIQAHFDNPVADKIATFIGKMEAMTIPKGTIGLSTNTPLGKIDEASQLSALITRCTLKINKERAELTNNIKETSGQKDPKAAADVCNKITDATGWNNKPYCSYTATETDETKKCQFNETKASKSGVPVTQTQTAGTESTTEKCKGKKNDECKSPDCKWAGEASKDSSIFINKKLAIFSAGFVSVCFKSLEL